MLKCQYFPRNVRSAVEMLVDKSEHSYFRPIRGREIISHTHTTHNRESTYWQVLLGQDYAISKLFWFHFDFYLLRSQNELSLVKNMNFDYFHQFLTKYARERAQKLEAPSCGFQTSVYIQTPLKQYLQNLLLQSVYTIKVWITLPSLKLFISGMILFNSFLGLYQKSSTTEEISKSKYHLHPIPSLVIFPSTILSYNFSYGYLFIMFQLFITK